MPVDCGPNRRVPRQDGRVQGPELTSFHKNTKLTTNCRTTTDTHTQKRYSTFKNKEATRCQEEYIHDNQIPDPQTGK